MNVDTFTPENGYLLVEPTEQEKQSSSGIILVSEASKVLPSTGKVLKSADTELINTIIFFNKYSGATITLEGKEYHVIKKEDIYGYCK